MSSPAKDVAGNSNSTDPAVLVTPSSPVPTTTTSTSTTTPPPTTAATTTTTTTTPAAAAAPISSPGAANITINTNIDYTSLYEQTPPVPADGHPLQSQWTFWFTKKVKSPGVSAGALSELSSSSQSASSTTPSTTATATPQTATPTSPPTATTTAAPSINTSSSSKETYENNLQEIGTFNTIEGFHSYYSYLIRPTSLAKDSNLLLFRGKIPAMWESFPQGGCFIVKSKKKSGKLLDVAWEMLLFAAIGELFNDADVVGVAVGIRIKEDVISVWNKDLNNNAARANILSTLQKLFGTSPVEFKKNAVSMKDRSSFKNAKLIDQDL